MFYISSFIFQLFKQSCLFVYFGGETVIKSNQREQNLFPHKKEKNFKTEIK